MDYAKQNWIFGIDFGWHNNAKHLKLVLLCVIICH